MTKAKKAPKKRAAVGGIAGHSRARTAPKRVQKRKAPWPRPEPPHELDRGRPRIFDTRLGDRLCAAVARAVPVTTACRIEGISRATFYNWRALGEAGEWPFADFYVQLQRAQAIAEASLLEHLTDGAKDSWRAAAWLLERRYPARYGARQTVRVEKAPGEMSDAELEAEIARLGYTRPPGFQPTSLDGSDADDAGPAPATLAELASIITPPPPPHTDP